MNHHLIKVLEYEDIRIDGKCRVSHKTLIIALYCRSEMGMKNLIIGIRTNGSAGRNGDGAQIQTWSLIPCKQNYKDQSKINACGIQTKRS